MSQLERQWEYSDLNFVMVINGLVLVKTNKMCLTIISTNKMRVVKSGGGGGGLTLTVLMLILYWSEHIIVTI